MVGKTLEMLSEEALLAAGASADAPESEMIPHFMRLPLRLRPQAGASWPMLSRSFLASQLETMDGLPLIQACALWPVSRDDVLRQAERSSPWWAVRILAKSPLVSAEDRRKKFNCLDGESLLDAGKTLPGIPQDDLARALDRLSPHLLFHAVCAWPGLRADDIRPHILRMPSEDMARALEEWPQDILEQLREDIEAQLSIRQLMGQ